MLKLHQSDAYHDAALGGTGMKALTIRNLPAEVADAVSKRSEEFHMSFSKAFVSLLEEHLSEGRLKKKKKRDLSWFLGTWTDEEARQFDEALREQRKIDPEMWK
jgi:hypothetical protein